MNRRNFIKGLLSIPFIGYVVSKWTSQYAHKTYSLGKWNLMDESVLDNPSLVKVSGYNEHGEYVTEVIELSQYDNHPVESKTRFIGMPTQAITHGPDVSKGVI